MTDRPTPTTPGTHVNADALAHQAVCPALKAMGLRPSDPNSPSAHLVPTLNTAPEPQQVRAVRYSIAAAGVCCVGLAAVGVVLPGMPTTIFLIMATWCFARSCPWLTERLLHNRFFGPFLKYVQPGAAMPPKAKAVALTMMWTAIAISCWLLIARGVPAWVPVVIAAAGFAGTWCIARQGRSAPGKFRA
ncbi:MAG: YbaN family protein [Phycisphaeraceae bacterium]|nr:YbaN family protein [Phycisphaeraceae bacterium]